MPNYVSIPHIRNGQPVDAANTSRPDKALEANLNYLRSQLSSITEGSALFLRGVLVESAAQVGMPVYYNPQTATFDRALAGAETDSDTGTLRPKAESLPVGIIYTKPTATRADLLIAGCASLDISGAVQGTPADGLYFLSSSNAGFLTQTQPYATVPVLQLAGDLVFLQLDLRDFLENHVHYSIEMACQPAGESLACSPGQRYTITSPDASFPGWLPANHTSFEGHAPIGAAFGYNLAADPALAKLWPPVPLQAVSFTWDKGRELLGGTDIPKGYEGLIIANTYGIWWMSDCYEDVPWPNVNFTLADLSSSQGAVSQSSVQECGREEKMRLEANFSKARFPNTKTAVTQLTADAGQPFEIVDADGNPASTGCLKLRLNLALLVDKTVETTSSLAITDYTGDKFTTGHFVRRLKSSSGRLVVSGGTEEPASSGKWYGDLILTLAESGLEILLPAELMHVDAAKPRYEEEVPCVGLLPDTVASIRYQFQVPFVGLPDTPKFKFRVWLLGSATGTLPTLTASYRRVTRPDGLTPTALPLSDSTLTIATSNSITADSYIEVESSEYTVTAGDTVLVTLNRASGDGYSGEVGILLASLVVVPGA